ncbi:MAG: SRPBCC family protein [Acidobacteriaceae bacterium]
MNYPFTLEREQWVPRPLDEVFSFFSDAKNLEALTPPWMRFHILSPQPIEIAAGTIIDYRLSWHGIPLRWKTEITTWEPPNCFVDLQLKGPYRLWHHTHRFRASAGGTQILDSVQYALPFGVLGRLVHTLSVRRNVEEIFEYRRRKVSALFGRDERAEKEHP